MNDKENYSDAFTNINQHLKKQEHYLGRAAWSEH